MNKFLIIILGPTGIGKTEISIEIAEKLDTEIISCDSRQIYKELIIGTAVPSPEQLKKIQHHFIGNKSIYDYYNASMFEYEVIELLEELFKEKNEVLMVGASGLYIDAVCKGLDDIPAVDQELRKKLIARYKKEGIENLRLQLKLLDPEYYSMVDLKNHNRILKALEVCYQTGKPYSSFCIRNNKPRNFEIIKISLKCNREELYQRINIRVENMIKAGLIKEARAFYNEKNIITLNTVGYKELFEHFEGKFTLDETIELIKRNSRRYAKRQFSWFAKDKEINWFHSDQKNEILEFVCNKICQ